MLMFRDYTGECLERAVSPRALAGNTQPRGTPGGWVGPLESTWNGRASGFRHLGDWLSKAKDE